MNTIHQQKGQARKLRAVLKEQGIKVTHTQALQTVARLEGFKNHQTFVGVHEKHELQGSLQQKLSEVVPDQEPTTGDAVDVSPADLVEPGRRPIQELPAGHVLLTDLRNQSQLLHQLLQVRVTQGHTVDVFSVKQERFQAPAGVKQIILQPQTSHQVLAEWYLRLLPGLQPGRVVAFTQGAAGLMPQLLRSLRAKGAQFMLCVPPQLPSRLEHTVEFPFDHQNVLEAYGFNPVKRNFHLVQRTQPFGIHLPEGDAQYTSSSHSMNLARFVLLALVREGKNTEEMQAVTWEQACNLMPALQEVTLAPARLHLMDWVHRAGAFEVQTLPAPQTHQQSGGKYA